MLVDQIEANKLNSGMASDDEEDDEDKNQSDLAYVAEFPTFKCMPKEDCERYMAEGRSLLLTMSEKKHRNLASATMIRNAVMKNASIGLEDLLVKGKLTLIACYHTPAAAEKALEAMRQVKMTCEGQLVALKAELYGITKSGQDAGFGNGQGKQQELGKD